VFNDKEDLLRKSSSYEIQLNNLNLLTPTGFCFKKLFCYNFNMNMKQTRMDNLSDGIFAIVMTLLVLELRVPNIVDFSLTSLVREFINFIPYLMSYITSFAVLYNFWHSHHFIASVYAKNITVHLSTINALFLFFIGIVPFTSHLMSEYSKQPFAIVIFSLNIIVLGFILFYMREHIKRSKDIENFSVTRQEEIHAQARILFPMFCALVAIIFSFIYPNISIIVLTLGILFNFSRKSSHIFNFLVNIK
jgi:uncharacterized membrane protein